MNEFKGKKTVTVLLDEQLWTKLTNMADSSYVSKADVIRQLIAGVYGVKND